jgi:uncharacterized YccA/Bax inhibitor family protein
MSTFTTSNPALRNDPFNPRQLGGIMAGMDRTAGSVQAATNTMTIRGTAVKTFVLLLCCSVTAVFTYQWLGQQLAQQAAQQVVSGRGLILPFILGGAVGGLVLGLIMSFAPRSSPFLAVPYALAEGAFLGAVSLSYAGRLGEGVLMQAVLLTFTILAALLGAFSFGLIRLSGTAMRVVTAAIGGVALLYLVNMLLRAFGNHSIPFIHDSSPIGIGFSAVVIVLASLSLVMDFQFIETGAQNGAPKYMEWYGGYVLLVTLVWLYLEILRLLSKMRRN